MEAPNGKELDAGYSPRILPGFRLRNPGLPVRQHDGKAICCGRAISIRTRPAHGQAAYYGETGRYLYNTAGYRIKKQP